jgi:hypothetical protein
VAESPEYSALPRKQSFPAHRTTLNTAALKKILVVALLAAVSAESLLMPFAVMAQTGTSGGGTPGPTAGGTPGASGAGSSIVGAAKCGGGLKSLILAGIEKITGIDLGGLIDKGITNFLKFFGLGPLGGVLGTFLGRDRVPTHDESAERLLATLVSKECTIDPIFRLIASVLIRSITNSIIAWITGDGGRNVGFVQNFERELRTELDIRGGEFLNQLAGVDLCGDLNAFLQLRLRASPSLRRRFACTVTDIVENVQHFFDDFGNGGWPAFVRISLQPQNNQYGAFAIGYDAMLSEQAAAALGLKQTYLGGQGYKGSQSRGRRCVDDPTEVIGLTGGGALPEGSILDQEKDSEGKLKYCYSEFDVKTPGGLIAYTLARTTNIGLDFTVVADELNEAFESIIFALLQKLINVSFSGDRGGGIFSRDSGFGYGDDNEFTEIEKEDLRDLIQRAMTDAERLLERIGSNPTLDSFRRELRESIIPQLRKLRSDLASVKTIQGLRIIEREVNAVVDRLEVIRQETERVEGPGEERRRAEEFQGQCFRFKGSGSSCYDTPECPSTNRTARCFLVSGDTCLISGTEASCNFGGQPYSEICYKGNPETSFAHVAGCEEVGPEDLGRNWIQTQNP